MVGFLNNCRFNATSSGTVDFVYASIVSGYQGPAAANVTSGLPYEYFATDNAGAWEIGRGVLTVSAGPVYTLARTTVLYNSAGTGTLTPGQSGAGSKISFGSVPQVAIVAISTSGVTIQNLTSGSGATYTTPAGCKWIEVFAVGGGGGGGGASSTATNAGSDGGTTTFNSVNAAGGKGATLVTAFNLGGVGGTGGTGTATRRARGGPGGSGEQPFATSFIVSGVGGSSYFSGGTQGVANVGSSLAGNAGDANSGAGGSGAYNQAGTNFQVAGGGGGGEFFYLLINDPAATYTYTIGAGGAGGVSTQNGGTGGSGFIFVIEHFGIP